MLYYIVTTEHRRRKSRSSSLSPSASSEEDGDSGGYNNSDDERISQQDGVDVLVSEQVLSPTLPASSRSRLIAQSTLTPHSLRSLPQKKKKKKRRSTDHSTHPQVSIEIHKTRAIVFYSNCCKCFINQLKCMYINIRTIDSCFTFIGI